MSIPMWEMNCYLEKKNATYLFKKDQGKKQHCLHDYLTVVVC